MTTLSSFNSSLLVESQQLLSLIIDTIQAKHPKTYNKINRIFELVDENLEISITRIQKLENDTEQAKTLLSDGEDLACDLMDDLEKLAKYDPDITGLTLEDIAKELYSQAKDIYDILEQGANL